MNEQKKGIDPRILTALVGIPLVLVVVYLGHIPFKILCLLLALGALRELQVAVRRSENYAGAHLLGGVGYIAIIFAVWNGLLVYWSLGTLAALLVLAVIFYGTRGQVSLASLSITLFCTLYVSLFALLPALRDKAPHLFWIVLACVWGSDTAAYYGGRMMGKRKISPLSPGKTWEGFACGLLAAMIIAPLVAHYIPAPGGKFLPIDLALGLGIILGVVSPLGDLAESFFKRELGVKDLGTLFPGHGGILDRCDSLLFAVLAVTLVVLGK